jgi:multidrug efflux system membrane fusion protein
MVDEGNVVRAQDTGGLVTVTQMRPISVIFTLPEQHLQAIRTEADKGALPVVAIGRDNANRLAEGSLSVIDSQIDSSTGTVRLKATFTNEDLKLWPGQFVNVRLRLAVRSKATVVPSQAVQMGPSGTFVFVISPENIVELRPVQVGRMEDGLALIESGLQSGERIVIDGQHRLQAGSRVRTGEGSKASAGAPSGAAAATAGGGAVHSAQSKPQP